MATLFVDPQNTINRFKNDYDIAISSEIICCMNVQLSALFELKTGLRINKQISISWASDWQFFVETGTISKVAFNIYVNHNWNLVIFVWKSKSGRIYHLHDTDIDCDDIEFWFEGLDVALIHKQMFPGDQLPFKIKNLSYELVVARITIDCTFELTLKTEHLPEADKVIDNIDNYFDEFNERSEKKKRRPGVIHSYRPRVEDNKIIYDIDLGSAGPAIFKDLLPYLSGLNYFTKVEIG